MDEWRDIPNYEGMYQASTRGRIRNAKTRHILSEYTMKSGYHSVTLGLGKRGNVKTELVHRLVASAFIKNSENKPFINHIDGDKSNNDVGNLEWVTPQENSAHAIRTGLIDPDKIREAQKISSQKQMRPVICSNGKWYASVTEAAKDTGASDGHITQVCRGERNTAAGLRFRYLFRKEFT